MAKPSNFSAIHKTTKSFARKAQRADLKTDDYLRLARDLKSVAPSLKKYTRRKTLKPAEKAAIKRAFNHYQEASRGGKIVPAHPNQVRSLDNREIVRQGNGIYGFKMANYDPTRGDEIHVRNGHLELKQPKIGTWRFEKQPPDETRVYNRVLEIWQENQKPTDVAIWSGAGWFKAQHLDAPDTAEMAASEISAFIARYRVTDPNFENWFEGLAILENAPV